ncbi:MAG: Spx/MgsR family RNA polymerase-binding regulatory protein, partial [Gammaproteobacteria bacterium]|nr:Spx/MgsR family RNA polymerase-binding regulatory protein [Gammaproteobacteria bacterium]
MITLYGIPNCDTMKKARKWLTDHGIDYQFHDYKKQGVPEKELRQWVKQLGWEALLNKRGTTWRKLDDTTRDNVD